MQFTGQAFLHTELNHQAPVVVGDTIHVEVEIVEVRKPRPGARLEPGGQSARGDGV